MDTWLPHKKADRKCEFPTAKAWFCARQMAEQQTFPKKFGPRMSAHREACGQCARRTLIMLAFLPVAQFAQVLPVPQSLRGPIPPPRHGSALSFFSRFLCSFSLQSQETCHLFSFCGYFYVGFHCRAKKMATHSTKRAIFM